MSYFDDYKKQMEIDYYIYFSKAYFAFNHYLKRQFSHYNDDRARINEAKKRSDLSKKFTKLLEKDTGAFARNLLHLHQALSSDSICNNGVAINFKNVEINSYYEHDLMKEKHKKIHYFVKMHNNGKFTISCGGKNFTCTYEELEQELKSEIQNPYQESRIKSVIDQEIYSYVKDIGKIIIRLEKSKTMENEECIDLYKGFIEIVYMLRNALFHSEINPSNKETKEAYEKAYFLLRDFIEELS